MGEIRTCLQLDSGFNSACRAITGCLKPTNVEELYLLFGIAPPSIRRDVCARVEKAKQETNEAERRLKSSNFFLHSVKPANIPPKVIRCSEWLRRTNKTPHRTSINLNESLARGHDSPWTYVQITHAARNSGRNGNTSMETQCGLVTENTAHMLQYILLA